MATEVISESEIHLDGGLTATTPDIVATLSDVALNGLTILGIENPDASSITSVESNTSDGVPYALHFTYTGPSGNKEVGLFLDKETSKWRGGFKSFTDVLMGM